MGLIEEKNLPESLPKRRKGRSVRHDDCHPVRLQASHHISTSVGQTSVALSSGSLKQPVQYPLILIGVPG